MKRQAQTAFSLLEVVIASFIFITTVIGILSVWTAHARGVAKARTVLIANHLGEAKMEECLAARYEHINELVTPAPPATLDSDQTTTVDFVIRDREVNVEFITVVTVRDLGGKFVPDASDSSITPIKQVLVEVLWSDSTTTQADDRRSIRLLTELHHEA